MDITRFFFRSLVWMSLKSRISSPFVKVSGICQHHMRWCACCVLCSEQGSWLGSVSGDLRDLCVSCLVGGLDEHRLGQLLPCWHCHLLYLIQLLWNTKADRGMYCQVLVKYCLGYQKMLFRSFVTVAYIKIQFKKKCYYWQKLKWAMLTKQTTQKRDSIPVVTWKQMKDTKFQTGYLCGTCYLSISKLVELLLSLLNLCLCDLK